VAHLSWHAPADPRDLSDCPAPCRGNAKQSPAVGSQAKVRLGTPPKQDQPQTTHLPTRLKTEAMGGDVGDGEGLELRHEICREIRQADILCPIRSCDIALTTRAPSLLRAVRLPTTCHRSGLHAAGTRAPPA